MESKQFKRPIFCCESAFVLNSIFARINTQIVANVRFALGERILPPKLLVAILHVTNSYGLETEILVTTLQQGMDKLSLKNPLTSFKEEVFRECQVEGIIFLLTYTGLKITGLTHLLSKKVRYLTLKWEEMKE